jgi:hypothetical protein
MLYGTKLYIPKLKDKLNTDGIIIVTDTGNPTFDFNIYTNTHIEKTNMDVYVFEWGTGEVAPSYAWGLNYYTNSQWEIIKNMWTKYKYMNGKLINFLQFNQEDTNIKNNKRY